MASGGEEDNPFSFKHFVKTKDKSNKSRESNDDDDSDNEEIPGLPDISTSSLKLKVVNQKNPTTKDENPFSFKKFLSRDATGCSSGARPKSTNSSATSSSRSRTIHITDSELNSHCAPDFASDLPDFVQDHFNTIDSPRLRTSSRDIELPDFALDTSSNNVLYDLPCPSIINPNAPLSENNHDAPTAALPAENDILPEVNGYVSSMHGGLPDFLSGSKINSAETALNGTSNRDGLVETMDLQQDVVRLRQENVRLQRELTEAHEAAEREASRVGKVVQDMEAIQRKDHDETSALEKMVQQVEANLEITTKRATKAETANAKLKQEVKNLKAQCANLQAQNELLKSGDVDHSSGRDQAHYAAEQLNTAADAAEQQLQLLLTGVENLRMVSRMLQSVSKVTEVEEENPSGGITD